MRDVQTITIKDVAKRAGVSVATVSRVLSGKGPMRPELRERVQRAISDMGYRPSRMARNFRAQRSKFIGLIISDIESPFYTSLVRSVEDAVYARGFSLLLCNSDEDPDKERGYIEFMADERVAGVVASPTRESETSLQVLLDARIPVVAVDRLCLVTPVDTVLLDNVTSANALTRRLINYGHRRIGAIVIDQSITSGRERLQGFLDALREANLEPAPELMREGKGIEKVGYEAALDLLSLPDPPTALFTGNAMFTIGALKAIRQHNLRIPEDISLAAQDELPWMPLLAPGITVSAQPIYEMGRLAIEMLMGRIEGDSQPIREVRLAPQLIVRQSVAPPAQVELSAG